MRRWIVLFVAIIVAVYLYGWFVAGPTTPMYCTAVGGYGNAMSCSENPSVP